MAARHQKGVGTARQPLDRHAQALWAQAVNMRSQQRINLVRRLVGNQAAGDLGAGLAGQHGFNAPALIAAPNAVQFQRRARPQVFAHAVALFAKNIGHPQLGDIGLLVKGHARDGLAVFDR